MKKFLFLCIVAAVAALFVYYYRLAGEFFEAEICIAYTSDIAGRIEVLPRIMTAVRQLKKECGGEVLLIDNGGTFSGAASELYLLRHSGEENPFSRLFNLAGYTFINISPDEFDYGQKMLRRHIALSGAQVITRNMTVLGASRMTEMRGITIGVHGLVSSADIDYRPQSLSDGVSIIDPFHMPPESRQMQRVDLNILALHADLKELFARHSIGEADFMQHLLNVFPFPNLILFGKDGMFSTSMPSSAIKPIYALSKGDGLGWAKLKIRKQRNGGSLIIVDTRTGVMLYKDMIDDQAVKQEFGTMMSAVSAAAGEPAATLGFSLQYDQFMTSETPVDRIMHAVLRDAVKNAGRHADYSLMLVSDPFMSKNRGETITAGDIQTMRPQNDYPVLVRMRAGDMVRFAETLFDKKPHSRPSIYPLRYTVSKEKAITVTEPRFDPLLQVSVIIPGSDLGYLAAAEDIDMSVEIVLPETIKYILMRNFPSSIYQPGALWTMQQ